MSAPGPLWCQLQSIRCHQRCEGVDRVPNFDARPQRLPITKRLSNPQASVESVGLSDLRKPVLHNSWADDPPPISKSLSIWADETHQRVTLAKLVKGVYELEFRRMEGISNERKPPARWWWESVHFELVGLQEEKQLVLGGPQRRHKQEVEEKSIDLAVYAWNSASSIAPPPQSVVVAIRGTLARVDDGWHNMHIPVQRLHETPRYSAVLGVVRSAVATHGSHNVCIVGHSLGAALGLLVARTLAAEGIHIESHLFNPVYPYTWFPGPHELIENEGLWSTVRVLRYASVVGLTNLLMDVEARSSITAEYYRLRQWTPHLYINKGDPICRGYWEYFHNHERLARDGSLGARVSSMAAPYSGRGLAFMGSKPMHLVPSAVLHFCPGASLDLWSDLGDYRYFNHNLKNWWLKDLQVHTREVRLTNCVHGQSITRCLSVR